MTDDPSRSADLPAGYDESNRYTDVDLSELPSWWRANVELFREHGLRPYMPAMLTDGEPLPVVLQDLEEWCGVAISVRTAAPQETNDWEIHVNGERVASVTRTKTEKGRSNYEIDSSTLEQIVAESADGKGSVDD